MPEFWAFKKHDGSVHVRHYNGDDEKEFVYDSLEHEIEDSTDVFEAETSAGALELAKDYFGKYPCYDDEEED